MSPDIADAWTKAHAGDPTSAFGCVVGFNEVVDAEAAARMAAPDQFIECIVAPGFEPAAITTLTQKPKWGKSLRLLKVADVHASQGARDRNLRRILDSHAEHLRIAHEMGVTVLLGTDAGSMGVEHGYAVFEEIERFREAGLPLQAVLAAATAAPRRHFGMAHATLAAGADAQILLLPASPFEHPAALRLA